MFVTCTRDHYQSLLKAQGVHILRSYRTKKDRHDGHHLNDVVHAEDGTLTFLSFFFPLFDRLISSISFRPGVTLTILDGDLQPGGWVYSVRTDEGMKGWISEKRLRLKF